MRAFLMLVLTGCAAAAYACSSSSETTPVTTEPEPPAAESGGTEGEPEATSVGDDSGSSRPQRSFVRRIFRRRQ